jgi:hypothetical protein
MARRCSTPIVANGTLYIGSQHIFTLAEGAKPVSRREIAQAPRKCVAPYARTALRAITTAPARSRSTLLRRFW